ncbi:hypothetical protein O181_030364 [Austropuccinia psidii MF-1]|uniref:Uncharacterized protein n=1 Tax=Austropuccinia psidii MF-1 TaxID=1389203 RepID=A0A9Q3CSR6_9BASI|nr:hypothetical protein [Austropuccinia psidii MF-1]
MLRLAAWLPVKSTSFWYSNGLASRNKKLNVLLNRPCKLNGLDKTVAHYQTLCGDHWSGEVRLGHKVIATEPIGFEVVDVFPKERGIATGEKAPEAQKETRMISIHLAIILVIHTNYLFQILASFPWRDTFNSEAATAWVEGMRQEPSPVVAFPPQSLFLDQNTYCAPYLSSSIHVNIHNPESFGSSWYPNYTPSRTANGFDGPSAYFSRHESKLLKTSHGHPNAKWTTEGLPQGTASHDDIPHVQHWMQLSNQPELQDHTEKTVQVPRSLQVSFQTEEIGDALDEASLQAVAWNFEVPQNDIHSEEEFKTYYALLDTIGAYPEPGGLENDQYYSKISLLEEQSLALATSMSSVLDMFPIFETAVHPPRLMLKALFFRMGALNSRALDFLGCNSNIQAIQTEERDFFIFLQETLLPLQSNSASCSVHNYNDVSLPTYPHPLLQKYLFYQDSGTTKAQPKQDSQAILVTNAAICATRTAVYFVKEYYKTKKPAKFTQIFGTDEGFFLFLKKLKYRVYKRSDSIWKRTIKSTLKNHQILPWSIDFDYEGMEKEKLIKLFTHFTPQDRKRKRQFMK